MFDTLNSHFEGIHSLTSKAQPEETTLQAEIATSEYIKFYRQCFPNRIIAKQHILKKNSTDFMHRTGFGLGFLRGQDGNKLHSTVSRLARSAAIRNDKNRMKNIIENVLLLTAPRTQLPCITDKTQTTTKIVNNIPHKKI